MVKIGKLLAKTLSEFILIAVAVYAGAYIEEYSPVTDFGKYGLLIFILVVLFIVILFKAIVLKED
jgi:hypothetical protein